MIQVRYALKWRDARIENGACVVSLREDGRGEMVGLVIGPEALARRFREGTARVVRELRPIATTDAGVAKILGTIGVDHDFEPTAA